ncbi:MAG: hypothetical protein JRH07_07375 [Deltaproteobacteria bacterium]|nr:hypothetical protein [Deltaproteobacteria bacterium]MBW2121651.1 hypothetical protein [Deltaproteobacteria bacterium]
MKRVLYAIALFAGVALAPAARAEVWHATQQWTMEEELRYGAWISEYVDENFFINHRIPVDCADVPYGLRWIYSRIRRLPAAATGKYGRFIGNWSSDWDRLPSHSRWDKDPRFRAALAAVLSLTTTESIPNDTYPIRVVPAYVTPGTVFLSTEAHTGVIARVVLDGSTIHPLQTWEASLPVKIQKLKLRDFLMHSPNAANQSGLLKFRWLEKVDGSWRYLERQKQPAYSEEQYRPDFFRDTPIYVDAVARRIDPRQHDPEQKAERVIDYIVKMLDERVRIVLSGYGYCSQKPCPEGSDMWETYSTPLRDRKIRLLFSYFDTIVKQNHLDPKPFLARMEATTFDIGNNKTIDLLQIYRNRQWLSYDPDDPVEMRWGLRKCEMIRARLATLQRAMRFVEKTYGDNDPGYADRIIARYRREAERLREEQAASGCEPAVMGLR